MSYRVVARHIVMFCAPRKNQEHLYLPANSALYFSCKMTRNRLRWAFAVGGALLTALLLHQASPFLEQRSGTMRKKYFASMDRLLKLALLPQEPLPLFYRVEKDLYIRTAVYDPRMSAVTLLLYASRRKNLTCSFYGTNGQLQVNVNGSQQCLCNTRLDSVCTM